MTFIIADDYPISALGVQVLLERAGHQVLNVYNNGRDAWLHIEKEQPSFVILDISMPIMDGLEVAAHIRNNNLPVKIILLTSHKEKSIYIKAQELKINAYLLKQYSLEELLDCIDYLNTQEYYYSKHLNFELENDKAYVKDEALNKLNFIEKKIFELVVLQKTTKEIAGLLFLSIKSIEAHRAEIIRKLDIDPGKNALLKYAAQFAN